jgi:hypothetical protein
MEKGERGEIPGTDTVATGARVCGRAYGGDAHNLQMVRDRGAGEQDAVMGSQSAQWLPRWLFVICGSAACGCGSHKLTAK